MLSFCHSDILDIVSASHFDGGSKHGNARKTKQEYVRTSPITKKNILGALNNKQPVREIFKEHFDSEHAPRDTKMVENMKSKLSKDTNPGNRQNTADDIQTILSQSANFCNHRIQNIKIFTNFHHLYFQHIIKSFLSVYDWS